MMIGWTNKRGENGIWETRRESNKETEEGFRGNLFLT
jgi:hypothetical protein